MVDDWLFGCDVCQDVCPWNEKRAHPHHEPRFTPRTPIVSADQRSLTTIGDDAFGQHYADTALERTGVSGIRRNACQVLANRGVANDKP
jgi:epoxyqueuosine reductase